MVLNDWGMVVDRCWDEVRTHFCGVDVDESVVMPNHVHAIIVIANVPHGMGEVSSPPFALPAVSSPMSAATRAPGLGGETPPLRLTLGQIVAYYKSQTTKRINLLREMPGIRFWQRNLWEHVIRDDEDLARICEYIAHNPARWADDQLHPTAQRLQSKLT